VRKIARCWEIGLLNPKFLAARLRKVHHSSVSTMAIRWMRQSVNFVRPELIGMI
jgi:hypothetical protein